MKRPQETCHDDQHSLSRRAFIGTAAAAAFAASAVAPKARAAESAKKFKLKYAPSLSAFRASAGNDPIDQIRYIADQGFSAMFDNGLMDKPADVQEKIGAEMARLNMTLGPFVLYADFGARTMVTSDQEARDMLLGRMKEGVEVAKRTGVKWALIVPGRFDERLEWDYQTANVVDNLRRFVEVVEPAGLVLVLEPLNRHDHPGLFLTKMPQAYQICKAVNNPCCKIVDDLYHQQITEGNLIPNIDRCWSEIGAFHLGDNPGRREPGTGEINFKNIFRHVHRKGYDGVLCMEHGTSRRGREGEQALIDAYRACDDFEV
ncbi:MAG: TIM barrel protein [Sedimentisphaerales bacterium]|nr:TIM barrel protein [Sedimentisphaerales bacterium]